MSISSNCTCVTVLLATVAAVLHNSSNKDKYKEIGVNGVFIKNEKHPVTLLHAEHFFYGFLCMTFTCSAHYVTNSGESGVPSQNQSMS